MEYNDIWGKLATYTQGETPYACGARLTTSNSDLLTERTARYVNKIGEKIQLENKLISIAAGLYSNFPDAIDQFLQRYPSMNEKILIGIPLVLRSFYRRCVVRDEGISNGEYAFYELIGFVSNRHELSVDGSHESIAKIQGKFFGKKVYLTESGKQMFYQLTLIFPFYELYDDSPFKGMAKLSGSLHSNTKRNFLDTLSSK